MAEAAEMSPLFVLIPCFLCYDRVKKLGNFEFLYKKGEI